jgi:hypothetical protein
MLHTTGPGVIIGTALVAVLATTAVPASADDAFGWRSAGVRGGVDDQLDGDDFKQFEAFATLRLPWNHRWPSGWSFSTFLEASAGTLRYQDESGFVGSVGPGGAFTEPGGRVRLVLGVNPTYLSRYRFGSQDLGGPFAFTTYLGAELILGRHGLVGLRWQHTSNANIYQPNPGYNQIVLQAGYGF